jgi:acyl phosphate:glycerol-3-phosphate acyltransferase
VCYVIGSFPTAYIIGKLHGINIFAIGSGNMGANNTTRALGLQWGVAVWAIDVFKGMIAIVAARQLMSWDKLSASVIGAIAVVVGHNWSFFAALITGTIRGGKGAATAGGTWIMLIPAQIFVVTVLLWLLLVIGTRYVSLAVLVAFAVGTAWVIALVGQQLLAPAYSTYALIVSALVYYRHRENIVALLQGRERRFMDKARQN